MTRTFGERKLLCQAFIPWTYNSTNFIQPLFQNEKELFIKAGNPTASPGYALFQALEILSYL